MLHLGYVDEVLFGYEVIERFPSIVKEWIGIAKNKVCDLKTVYGDYGTHLKYGLFLAVFFYVYDGRLKPSFQLSSCCAWQYCQNAYRIMAQAVMRKNLLGIS